MVSRGYSEEQVIQDFVGRFGPSVLVANAALAPNSDGSPFNKKIFGYLLLMAGFSVAAFTVGKYMSKAPVAPSTRRRSSSGPRPEKGSARKSKGKSQSRKGVDDELLDDYYHE
jgi:hypothetical protein